MLLPFMLISGLMVQYVSKKQSINKPSTYTYGIFTSIVLGITCGYPIGAKTCADFIKNNSYSSKIGNILLPLCNNSSPMFISGYIVYRILQQRFSLLFVMLCIYIPYIIVTLLSLFVLCIADKHCKKTSDHVSLLINRNETPTKTNDIIQSPIHKLSVNDYLLNTINQITMVGIYIMICSIFIELINNISYINEPLSSLLSGLIEITRGVDSINSLVTIDGKTKTALIISVTSFGGLSSILQTQMVIEKSGLSIIYYSVIKVICAIMTFFYCILLI
ncbi:MAG: hypothetical protein J6A25_06500 [Lachnospiraceae bacterium]|nr:hypothetical protein [Lachnospiraceae bacterium]